MQKERTKWEMNPTRRARGEAWGLGSPAEMNLGGWGAGRGGVGGKECRGASMRMIHGT